MHIRVSVWILACSILATSLPDGFASWRSTLVPEDWIPPHERDGLNFIDDRFIQDFSYAGYHLGEKPLPRPDGPVFDVVSDYGADPAGTIDATAAIQAAINAAGNAGGGIVWLPEGTYRLSVASGSTKALTISKPNVILRGAGPGKTFLFNETYQMRGKAIIEMGPVSTVSWSNMFSAAKLLTADYTGPTKEIAIQSVAGFSVGDWIVVYNPPTEAFVLEINMGPGADTVDWTQSLSSLGGPRYLRQVTAIDAAANTLTLDAPARWALRVRDGARIYKAQSHLAESGIEGFSIGNARHPGTSWGENDYSTSGTAAYEVHGSSVIKLKGLVNCWVREIATYNPGNNNGTNMLSNGIVIDACRGVTLYRCSLQYAQYGGGGGNGYAIRLNAANECMVVECEAGHVRHGLVVWRMENSGNVFLRNYDHHSKEQRGHLTTTSTSGSGSDHHGIFSHSNLFDSTRVESTFLQAAYRGDYGSSPSHGMTSSQTLFWNTEGVSRLGSNTYVIHSQQFGHGYAIGTSGAVNGVRTSQLRPSSAERTDPVDFVEGVGLGATLAPQSLYLFQFLRRVGRENLRLMLDIQANSGPVTLDWNLPPGLACFLWKSADLHSWSSGEGVPASGPLLIADGEGPFYQLQMDSN